MRPAKPASLWVFYHYLYPDNVVSAVLMDQLACGFAEQGWSVTGYSGNRGSRDESPTYPSNGSHGAVRIRRLWRPALQQASTLGRLLNAAWMITAWSLLACHPGAPDALVIGTDPILSILTAIPWKLLHPRTRIVHWCFDVYPEAAYADGLLSPDGRISRVLAWLLRRAYGRCDAIVDIGPCMRDRLAHYASPARTATIVPWALEEPCHVLGVSAAEREVVAGHARLALLYSGSFGRAHVYEDFLALASALKSANATLGFSVRGNREADLRQAVAALPPGSTCPIHFVPFASEDRLLDRLAAADVHLLSLASHWTGLVVPSKFFGALAVGRPILFSGSPDSSIARWIREYALGWVLGPGNAEETAADLLRYIEDPVRIAAMQQRCFAVYQRHFSRASGITHMRTLVDQLLKKPKA